MATLCGEIEELVDSASKWAKLVPSGFNIRTNVQGFKEELVRRKVEEYRNIYPLINESIESQVAIIDAFNKISSVYGGLKNFYPHAVSPQSREFRDTERQLSGLIGYPDYLSANASNLALNPPSIALASGILRYASIHSGDNYDTGRRQFLRCFLPALAGGAVGFGLSGRKYINSNSAGERAEYLQNWINLSFRK